MKDLKQRTIRGGLARLCAQGANFFLRLGSLVVLARLLGPKDFGLVGMVTAFTGILTLFRDFGLSSAAIQRTHVSDEQISTLFWINIFVGMLLGLLAVVGAPIIAAFYHEPRLVGVTAVLALGFLFNAAGVQHSVLLQRQMRFTALAVINTVGLIAGTAVGIGGARAGYGYWALVGMTLTIPLISTVGFWLTTAWVPGKPHRQTGIRSMLRFGGTVTLKGLVSYLANNVEKVLLGRFWGVDALGIYGRAYQLVNIPTDNLNFAAGGVAFSALSRLQDDPSRLKRYFLAGYSVVLALTCLVIAPLMILSCVVAMPYGPRGVAFAYSTVMMLWVLPAIAWTVHGTVISVRDMLLTVSRPLASSLVAGTFAFGVQRCCVQLSPLLRLTLESSVLLITFVGMLLFVTGQKVVYLDLLRGLRGPIPGKEEQTLVSA